MTQRVGEACIVSILIKAKGNN